MPNSIAAIKSYTTILDRVYQREATSSCLNSPARMARAGRNVKEIMIPKISVTGLGDYTRNVGYKTGSIDFAYETKAFNYDRGIKLLADVMDVEEAGAELERTQVAPEADAFTYAAIALHEGVTTTEADLSSAKATDVLAALRKVTNTMDEAQVTPGSRYLFITPTLKGVLDDYSLANPNMSNRVLTRFCRVVEVPQARFYTKISLNSGDSEKFGYVYDKGSVTAMKLTDYLQRSMKVSRDLKPLVEKGILDWHGSSTHNPSHCYGPHGFKWVRVEIAYVYIAGDYTSANWRWTSCVIRHPPRANERGK